MFKPSDITFANGDFGLSLKFVVSNEAVYAVLLRGEEQRSCVWLWNLYAAPEEWPPKVDELPANIKSYIDEEWAFVPPTSEGELSVRWIEATDGNEVALYLRGELIALLSESYEIGWSRMAKDGPLAYSLIESVGPPPCERMTLAFDDPSGDAQLIYEEGEHAAYAYLLRQGELQTFVWLWNTADHCPWKSGGRIKSVAEPKLQVLPIRSFDAEKRIICPLLPSAVSVAWRESSLGREACLYFYGELVAILPFNDRKGYSLAVRECELWSPLEAHPDYV